MGPGLHGCWFHWIVRVLSPPDYISMSATQGGDSSSVATETKRLVGEMFALQRNLLGGKVMSGLDESEVRAQFSSYSKANKPVVLTDLFELLTLSNSIALLANVLLEKAEEQDPVETAERVREETRQIAQDAARELLTQQLTTFQDNLMLKLDEKIREVQLPVQTSQIEAPTDVPAEVMEPVKRCKILVESTSSDDKISEEGWQKVKEKMNKTKVNGASLTKMGRGTLSFPDAATAEAATAILAADPSFKVKDITTKKEPKILPKIKVENLSKDMFQKRDKETRAKTLIDAVMSKNEFLNDILADKEETFEVIYMNERDRSAVVKVSPSVRECLRDNRDKLHIDMGSHEVHDHFQVTQCFHCQGFGHKKGEPKCPAKNSNPTCLYCAKGHKSGDCNFRRDKSKHCCINCRDSSDRFLNNNARYHTSSSDLCPIVIREKKSLMARTIGVSEKSKNEYARKMRTIQEQVRSRRWF